MDHEGPQNRILQIDEALVKRELGEVVRETVEETLPRVPQTSPVVALPVGKAAYVPSTQQQGVATPDESAAYPPIHTISAARR